MANNVHTLALLSSLVTMLFSGGAFGQSVQPGYPVYRSAGSVPTLNLPNQTNATIGQVSGNQTTEITRTMGQTRVFDPQAVPQTSSDDSLPTSPAKNQTTPLVGRNPTLDAAKAQASATQTSQGAGANQAKYRVGQVITGLVHVADGHSLLVGTSALRLNGVEAPGLKQLCFSGTGIPWKCGEASMTRLKSLMEGRNAVCRVEALAGTSAAVTCAVQGIADVSKIMIEEGLVTVNQFGTAGYRSLQADAAHERAGMWVGSFTEPAQWRLKNRS